jgi:hypothetical protein
LQVFPLLPGLGILWHMPAMGSAVIRDLIEEARSAGVSFRVDGTRLHFEAAAPPPADLVARLRACASGIVDHLRTEGSPSSPVYSLPEERTPAELLTANLHRSLARQAELLDLPLDPDDPRVARLIADVANQTLNAALRAQENTLAAKRDDDEHDREMEALIEERRQKAILEIARMEREAPYLAAKENTGGESD